MVTTVFCIWWKWSTYMLHIGKLPSLQSFNKGFDHIVWPTYSIWFSRQFYSFLNMVFVAVGNRHQKLTTFCKLLGLLKKIVKWLGSISMIWVNYKPISIFWVQCIYTLLGCLERGKDLHCSFCRSKALALLMKVFILKLTGQKQSVYRSIIFSVCAGSK